MAGLDLMRAIQDGSVPSAPIASLIGMTIGRLRLDGWSCT